jgi:hypothetical protein
MTIPTHLDTYVTDRFIFRPEMGIHKRTYEPTIIVMVTDRSSNTVVNVAAFKTVEEYADFVDSYTG